MAALEVLALNTTTPQIVAGQTGDTYSFPRAITGTTAFGVAGTSKGVITLSGNTSGTVTVQPAAAAGTWSLTLPTGAGTNTYALLTDGAGVTSWGQIAIGSAVSGLGTGVATALAVNVGSAGAFVTLNGALGTPSSGTLTNCTLPVGGLTGLATGIATWLATPSSANLASAVTDETGSGALVFGTSPTISSPTLNGNITTQTTTFASQNGIFYRGSNRFIHDFNYGNNGTVTTNGWNTFVGELSGNFTMGSTATDVMDSSKNTGVGYETLRSNTTGKYNTAVGTSSLKNNTTGASNTAVGVDSQVGVQTGSDNSSIGVDALQINTSGFGNSAIGNYTLQANTGGFYNTALGIAALYTNISGNYNTALGPNALRLTTGSNNVALGAYAGYNQTGSNNFFVGNVQQTNIANDRAYSLLYGTFSGTAGSLTGQQLTINGTLNVSDSIVGANTTPISNRASNVWTVFNTNTSFPAIDLQSSLGIRLGNALYMGWNSATYNDSGSVDLFLTRKAAAFLQHGAADAASPVAQTIGVQSVVAGTSNTAGANWTLKGSAGTGTGAGGSIIFQTAAAGGPGTSQNSYASALSIDSAKAVLALGTGGLGYGTGAGGAVTQATSRTTGVTLNTPCGAITLVSAAGSTTWQTFTVTNSTVAATDTIYICQKSGTDKNMIFVTAVAAGSFEITFATTGGTTTEQPVFNFAVIKAVTS